MHYMGLQSAAHQVIFAARATYAYYGVSYKNYKIM
jgi:hypothetical protein